MPPHADRVAARLGFDGTTITGLRARRHLDRLALTEPEIRDRLYRAHLTYLRTRAGCTESSGAPITSRPSPEAFPLEPW